MAIWLILTIWMLLAAVFVLAICAAAARPIPQPGAANVEQRKPVNREIEMQTLRLRATEICCLAILTIALAAFTTSCATTNGNWSPDFPEKGSAKGGASLLMRR